MNNFTNHVGDLAELYALGSLSAPEAAEVLGHAAQCEECRNRVRDAETAVTEMIESDGEPEQPPAALRRRVAAIGMRRPVNPYSWGAIAAALVLWIVPASLLYNQNRSQVNVISAQSTALHALVHSHFLHAQFVSSAPDAPAAKVIYAKTGGWFYVIVDAEPDGLQIGTVTPAGARVLGTLAPVAHSSAFFYPSGNGMHELVLIRAGKVIAHAPMAR